MVMFISDLSYSAIALLVTILVLVLSYYKWCFAYWKRKGFIYLEPSIPFGNVFKLFASKVSFGEQFEEFYTQLKKKGAEYGGIYWFARPFFVPVDPALVKDMMQTNFSHFVDRGFFVDEENDPLSGHLFSLEGSKWKNLRAKLTATFTSGKMKMMYETMANCAKELENLMDNHSSNNQPLDVRDTLARFTTDIITSCAFGVEGKSLKDPNTPIRHYGRRIVENTFWENIRALAQFMFDKRLLHAIKFKTTKPDVEEFLFDMIKNVVEYREQNNVYRKDFLHLLLQLKNRGKLSDDEKILDDDTTSEKGLTMNELAAQCFVFFVAGYETSSTAMTFTLYELSQNQSVQEKARKEIKAVLDKHDGIISYDALMEMTYLEQVINESLRMYPPVPFLNRICTKKYKIPNSDLFLEEGTMVVIPNLGLQKDPEYFPEPSKFDPDRFSQENKNKQTPFTWLPFGEGPRICIGLRFGLLQTKLGLVTFLRNHRVTLSDQTKTPLKLNPKSFVPSPLSPILLNVSKLE